MKILYLGELPGFQFVGFITISTRGGLIAYLGVRAVAAPWIPSIGMKEDWPTLTSNSAFDFLRIEASCGRCPFDLAGVKSSLSSTSHQLGGLSHAVSPRCRIMGQHVTFSWGQELSVLEHGVMPKSGYSVGTLLPCVSGIPSEAAQSQKTERIQLFYICL